MGNATAGSKGSNRLLHGSAVEDCRRLHRTTAFNVLKPDGFHNCRAAAPLNKRDRSRGCALGDIRRAFPELRANGSSVARTRQSAVAGGDEPTPSPTRHRRRTMSAAQRKAVGERMKKYWAARRGGGEAARAPDSASTAKGPKPTRRAAKRRPSKMSPEARKRISDAQKARWAKQRQRV